MTDMDENDAPHDRRRPGRWVRDATHYSSNANGGRVKMSTVLTMLGLVVAIGGSSAGVYVTLAGDLRETGTRVEQNERRIIEDRQASTADRKEIKNDVKQIGVDMQLILRKLDAQEAREIERAERLRRERSSRPTQ